MTLVDKRLSTSGCGSDLGLGSITESSLREEEKVAVDASCYKGA